ncbi:MAG: hypothetical protein LBS82_03315 [Spirochaetaceae bacterium]|nr:hypothetical protein [Spirochaetaceae bacterium]
MRAVCKLRALCALFLCALLLGSCGSTTALVEWGGRALDGSVFAFATHEAWAPLNASGGLEVRLVAGRDGARELAFSSSDIPYLTFFGSEPADDGAFSLKRVHFLAGNFGGWNEAEIAASGEGRFRRLGVDYVSFALLGGVALEGVTGGKIRRENTRLTGERALEELKNRNERIAALAAWMKGAAAEGGAPAFADEDAFEAWWGGRLFSLPAGEDVAAMRENGSLAADWNEAAAWIYLYCRWDELSGVLRRDVVLGRVE